MYTYIALINCFSREYGEDKYKNLKVIAESRGEAEDKIEEWIQKETEIDPNITYILDELEWIDSMETLK